jgi:hypothetical protein
LAFLRENLTFSSSVLTDLIAEATATKDALDAAHRDIVTSREAGAAAPAPAPYYEADLFGYDAPAPAPAPATHEVEPVLAAKPPAPATMHNYDAPAPARVASGESTESAESVTYQQQHTQQHVPSGMFGSMNIGQASSFEQDGLMGGVSSMDGSSFAGGYDSIGAGPSTLSAGAFSHNPPKAALTAADVEAMKEAAINAEKKATEADETFRTLAAEADKLRSAADEAEAQARSQQEAASHKKRGIGRGKKKQMVSFWKLALLVSRKDIFDPFCFCTCSKQLSRPPLMLPKRRNTFLSCRHKQIMPAR